MNRKMFSTMAALALMTVAGVASAYAQEAEVKATVPFAFSVNSSTLPAGDYTLGQLSQNIWEIRQDDGPAILALVEHNGTNEQDSAKLVFKHAGDRYFLSEVKTPGQNTLIPASKAEREAEREMASNGSKPETLYVLASIR